MCRLLLPATRRPPTHPSPALSPQVYESTDPVQSSDLLRKLVKTKLLLFTDMRDAPEKCASPRKGLRQGYSKRYSKGTPRVL